MNNPKITYHILEDINTYVSRNEAYMGTYTGDEPLSVTLRIWNNFRGTEDVKDLEHFNFLLRFLTKEDNALLPYVSLTVNTTKETILPIIENNAAVFSPAQSLLLQGNTNTGSDEYTQNYVDITISFKADSDAYLKDHDLKSLILDIVEQ